jgi:hypothetical protein
VVHEANGRAGGGGEGGEEETNYHVLSALAVPCTHRGKGEQKALGA